MNKLELYGYANRQEVIKWLEDNQPLQIAFHSDADGVASAAILAEVFDVVEDDKFPYSPSLFGAYNTGNVAVDLGAPAFEGYKGLVIDHHPHVSVDYNLVLGNVPTGGVLYELLKDRIPDNKLYLVALSLCGDGQPELIPDEIWDKCPSLLHQMGNIYKDRYNNIKAYPYPLYAHLSPVVNALCRTNRVMGAYQIVRSSKSVRDIANNIMGLKAREEIKSEISKIYSEKDPSRAMKIEQIGYFAIVQMQSRYHVASRIASEMSGSYQNITFIVINSEIKEVSIRGVRATYIASKMSNMGYMCGGHPMYCACSILPGQDIDEFTERLRQVLGAE